MSRYGCFALALTLSFLPPPLLLAQKPQPLEFLLSYDKKVGTESFNGRVYVILDRPNQTDLPDELDWFVPQPLLAVDVKGWKPGQMLVIGKNALAYPPVAKIPEGKYSIHAVMDFDRGNISFSAAEGNGYSKPLVRELHPETSGPIKVVLDQVFHAEPFHESETIKLVDIESPLLTKFQGKSVHLRAGVRLPKSFAGKPQQRYPVVYEIPGFGGDHESVHEAEHGWTDLDGVECIHVVLDPNGRAGHHMFVDSAIIGPYGTALVEELIPYIEKKYRGLGKPTARFVTGHSSGGWTSLWLQITHPDFFGGCWSTAPDEVDFRDFQRTNIYQNIYQNKQKEVNFFEDENGKPRPMGRIHGRACLFNKPFSDLEVVMGHGGQLGSYEAIFSPRGADGQPRLLWDRKTGRIDPEVARYWQRYDIRLVLERNWETLGPKLKGKIHLYVGSKDTFYLEVAAGMLKESQAKLNSDAVIEIIPDRDHGSLVDKVLLNRIKKEMAEQLRR